MIKHYPIDEEDLVIVGTVSKKEMVEKLNYAYHQGREDYQAECEKLFGDNPPMHFTTEQRMWVIERIKQGRADAIEEFCEKLLDKAVEDSFLVEVNGIATDCMTVDYLADLVTEVAEQLKEQ